MAALGDVINEKTKISVGSARLSLMIWIGTVIRLTPAGIVTVPVPPTKSRPLVAVSPVMP